MTDNLISNIQNQWVSDKMEWKSLEEYILFLKQKKAYDFFSLYCKEKFVLDYGCGSGYGTRLLSDFAKQAIGVDISERVIDYCNRQYSAKNLLFKNISPDYSLPFEANFFDVIVSSQVIEHIPDVYRYLFELKRVLKDQGILFLTTPNKRYRLLPFQRPWNPEHLREYSMRSFKREIESVFKQVEILGVYGNNEINAIEHKRVKQKPLSIYVFGPGKKMLRTILPSSLLISLKSLTVKAPSIKEDVRLYSKYNLEDFTVGNDLQKSLDFVAICRK
jgi:SAM-dependent methyltransferase